jgi:hypothetical protein
MSNDPNVIRQQIETTRGELSSDVDALTDRVNPRRVATRRAERVRGRFDQIKGRVMGTAVHGREAAGERTSHARHRLTDTAEQASGAVSGTAHQASEAASLVADRARAVPQMSRERTGDSPLRAGMVAFAAGLLASSLIPPSGREKQLAEQAKQKATDRSGGMKQQAGGMARQMRENLREPAQHAAESVRSKAAESASAVRDQGMSTAQQVQGRAREGGEAVRY